jgi:sulfate transport system permease protein
VGGRRSTRIGLRTFVLLYVGILVLVPLALVIWRAFEPGWRSFTNALQDPGTVHAFELSFEIAVIAVVINTVFGVGLALLLTRFRFPGQGLLSAFVDLPVSISPIVVGFALTLVYGRFGWFGTPLADLGIQVIYTVPGMVLATVFVSLPLVVRAVAPVLAEAGTDQEQAARSLGANALTRFRRITLPTIRAAIAYGVVLSLARCLGEYGAVLVVSGNIEGQTETATLRISNLVTEDLRPNDAYALTFVLVTAAILAILAITLLRRKVEA